ncbi:MAG: AsmA family protein [Candidatus Sulfotelmatobacter sp.]
MKILSSRRRIWVAAAGVVLILFVLRPGASSLKSRITSSLAAALGRPVEIGAVHISLLPRPGFDLENLVVYDAPAFGSEPLLRAPEVTAALRLTSLVRGRMEIARLDLSEPSFNLVRSEGSRWNLEVLLERTAHVPLAPTAKAKSEPRPAFPYIQVSSGRINFKFGQEKKPYALTNADFSLWQDSENSWGVRLRAQPFRSDMNLSDTGLLRVNGTWQRAASLRETPLQFAVEWDRPQLGQLTKFLTGTDKGWRGTVMLDATLAGTPAQLQVTSDVSVRDFRRYDILSGEPVGMNGHCDARYSSVDHTLHQVSCQTPVGTGLITLHGQLGLPGSHSYDLVLTAEGVPASAAMALAQRAKKNLPDDLIASGTVEGSFSMQQNGKASEAPHFEGRGEIANLRLASAGNKAELATAAVPFWLAADAANGTTRHMPVSSPGPRLEFGPVALASGKAAASARGWMSPAGYGIDYSGETEIGRALRAAHLFGLPALTTTAEGAASVNLQIAGNWAHVQPQVTGTAKLRNVRVQLYETNRPVEISAADLQFSPDDVKVSRMSVNAAHAIWIGSLELPRGCGTPSACLVHFSLNSSEAALSDLRQWAQPNQIDRPWYSLLASNTKKTPSFLASLRATGRVTLSRLLMRSLAATEVSANVNLDSGKLRVSDLRGQLLCGTHSGDWQADFTRKPPVYSGSGTLTGVSMGCIADSMNDPWIAGLADGKYQLTASGLSSEDFWRSADAAVQFEVRDGVLPHLSLASDNDPLKITLFEGRAHLHEGMIAIKDATLDSPAGAFQLSGTASLTRELDFKLSPASPVDSEAATPQAYTITGTLAQPQAVRVTGAETQARLKP